MYARLWRYKCSGVGENIYESTALQLYIYIYAGVRMQVYMCRWKHLHIYNCIYDYMQVCKWSSKYTVPFGGSTVPINA